MALNIKDPVTDRIARQLSEATGESLTVAVRSALEERLARILASAQTRDDQRLQALIDRGRARPRRDSRTDEAILGYDETGLPR